MLARKVDLARLGLGRFPASDSSVVRASTSASEVLAMGREFARSVLRADVRGNATNGCRLAVGVEFDKSATRAAIQLTLPSVRRRRNSAR